MLAPAESAKESQSLQRYMELCKVAFDAKNYNEALKYCNLILEIDPKIVEVWILKSISTFWLTTGANNRYAEAIEYLNRAAQLAPGDIRVEVERKGLARQQANWYNHLGNERWKAAKKWYELKYDGNRRMGYFTPGALAKQETQEDAIKAMDFYLLASGYAPDDSVILENIANCAKFYDVVGWTDKVKLKIKTLEALKAKVAAVTKIPGLRAEREKKEVELGRVKQRGGFFASSKIKGLEESLTKLDAEINQWELSAAYELPKLGNG